MRAFNLKPGDQIAWDRDGGPGHATVVRHRPLIIGMTVIDVTLDLDTHVGPAVIGQGIGRGRFDPGHEFDLHLPDLGALTETAPAAAGLR